jgi:hypothetical protein
MVSHYKNSIGFTNIFVIMPFDKEYNDLYILGIKETILRMNMTCERIDEKEFNGHIIDKIMDIIKKSELIICMVSPPNPNVYFELGYAYGKRKKIVLLTNNTSLLPFNIRSYRHIVYEDICDLKVKLQTFIEDHKKVSDIKSKNSRKYIRNPYYNKKRSLRVREGSNANCVMITGKGFNKPL